MPPSPEQEFHQKVLFALTGLPKEQIWPKYTEKLHDFLQAHPECNRNRPRWRDAQGHVHFY